MGSGWAILAFVVLACIGFVIAALPVLLIVLAEEQRDELRRKNSTGGRNYVE